VVPQHYAPHVPARTNVQDSCHSVIRGCVGKGLRLMWHRWFLERSPVEVLSVSITCQVVGQPTGGPACVSRSSAGREVRGASHSQPQAIAQMTGVSAHRFSDAAGCTSVASSGPAISFAMRVPMLSRRFSFGQWKHQHFATLCRRKPRRNLAKALRNIELDYLCHSSSEELLCFRQLEKSTLNTRVRTQRAAWCWTRRRHSHQEMSPSASK
jgi:hypothetical protein